MTEYLHTEVGLKQNIERINTIWEPKFSRGDTKVSSSATRSPDLKTFYCL